MLLIPHPLAWVDSAPHHPSLYCSLEPYFPDRPAVYNLLFTMKVGPTVLLLLVIVLVIAAILCHVIALSTDYWLRSSNSVKKDFLNIGLFVACFKKYVHPHDNPPREYDGCHQLDSAYYSTIRDWLVPGRSLQVTNL